MNRASQAEATTTAIEIARAAGIPEYSVKNRGRTTPFASGSSTVM